MATIRDTCSSQRLDYRQLVRGIGFESAFDSVAWMAHLVSSEHSQQLYNCMQRALASDVYR